MGYHKRLLIDQQDREDAARRAGKSWEDMEEWEQKEADEAPAPAQLVLNLDNPTDEPPPPFGEP